MGHYVLIALWICGIFNTISALNSPWSWECLEGYCEKRLITNETEGTALSLSACRLVCSEYAAIWPYPTGSLSVSHTLTKINPTLVDVVGVKSVNGANIWKSAITIFKKAVKKLVPESPLPIGGKSLIVNLKVNTPDITRLSLDTDESYSLKVSEIADGKIEAIIEAATFFGTRHGLETLTQLIIFDDLRDECLLPSEVSITDKPAYPYRGILLDTARNYININTIKKTLDAMGASKLNTFHWHITDTHSFPFVSKSRPELSKYGAYSPKKVYTHRDIEEIVQYGLIRGIRVMPEFDAPAHVGEGWQNTEFVTCFNWQPWQSYCVEPPCGQLDPTKDKLYNYLEGLYKDIFEVFKPDIFHMGGDEVNFNCWNKTTNIVEWMTKQGWKTDHSDFIKLWNHFQSKALEKVYKIAGKEVPVIMWTSSLTDNKYILNSLPKEKYIIQVWTEKWDPQINHLLENGYNLILSNYDALYLDCGFAGWVTNGNNWCSPYIGWQKVYDNKIASIAGSKKNLVLGSEAALWTEQADSSSVDTRLWPRAAAMAEVLWSEPVGDWSTAEQRFLVHRERLVSLGLNADAIEPQWCLHNEEHCRIGGAFNKAS